jgi:hypothetical protein
MLLGCCLTIFWLSQGTDFDTDTEDGAEILCKGSGENIVTVVEFSLDIDQTFSEYILNIKSKGLVNKLCS